MRNIWKAGLLAILLYLYSGCSGKKADNAAPAPPVPGQASLLFPNKDMACTTATVISTSQSSVNFTWAASPNTDSYQINIKNLSTGETSNQVISETKVTLTLKRNMPYSWYIISRSGSTTQTSQSDTWKFFLPAEGVLYYTPYPADSPSPADGQAVNTVSGKITLSWTGSDPDNDITAYDVYIGTSNTTLTTLASNVSNTSVSTATLTSGTTYYWQVITNDSKGNKSNSPVFQFKTN